MDPEQSRIMIDGTNNSYQFICKMIEARHLIMIIWITSMGFGTKVEKR